ncbi:MAG: hypothetical protein ACR2LI_13345 [Propionibacteriaceae bacterium]
MSTADGWDLTVPEDEAALVAELRRHGVVPGQRLHIEQAPPEAGQALGNGDPRKSQRRRLDFIGSIDGGPTDLSERTDEYLQRGFGRE